MDDDDSVDQPKIQECKKTNGFAISSLAIDSHGRVWIGSDAVLGVFDLNAP